MASNSRSKRAVSAAVDGLEFDGRDDSVEHDDGVSEGSEDLAAATVEDDGDGDGDGFELIVHELGLVDGARGADQVGTVHESQIRTKHSHPRVITAVRAVLNRYELLSGGQLPEAVAVVSALRGEGVTTMSQALAETLAADLGRSVCWVDLSMSRPGSGVDGNVVGLYEVIAGEATLDDALAVCEHTDLHLLAGGAVPADRQRSFARRPELDELIEELKSRFDVLVFDTAPILSNSDTLALMRFAEAQMLVVRHGITNASQVRSVVEQVRTVPSIGAVLNQYRTRTPRFIRRLFGE